MNIFDNLELNKEILLGTYKKLKSIFYYNKDLLFNRVKISLFENDSKSMDEELNKLAKFLQYPESLESENYFIEKIKMIDFRVLPKAYVSTKNEAHKDIISNVSDNNKTLEKVNFFMDAPVELMLLDLLWTILLGRICYDQNAISDYAYANRIENNKVFFEDVDFLSSIDFESNRLFEPYFKQYSHWKDNAISKIKIMYENKKDSILLSLDLKSYFYSVRFRFDSLNTLLNNDTRLSGFVSLTKKIERIYVHYTNEMKKYRANILANCENSNECIFPIGLISCNLLSNLYLKEFDNSIYEKIKPAYYGRYVDDFLVLIDAGGVEDINLTSVIINSFVKEDIFKVKDDNTYELFIQKGLMIQKDKVRCFYFNHKESPTLVEILFNKFRSKSASSVELMPGVEFDDSTFDEVAYSMENLTSSIKVRDLGFLTSNNFLAIRYLNDLIRSSKNIKINDETQLTTQVNKINNSLKQIKQFYSGTQALEYRNAWMSIFYYAVINMRKDFALSMYTDIRKTIENLAADKIYDIKDNHKSYVLKKVKESLIEELDSSLSIATALNISFSNNKDICYLALQIRKANMFNHHLTSYPLINFTMASEMESFSLLETDLDILTIKEEGKADGKLFELDYRKLELSPRFIHLSELNIFEFIKNYKKGGNIFNNRLETINNMFCKINGIKIPFEQLEYENEDSKDVITQKISCTTRHDGRKGDTDKIALVSLLIDENRDVLPVLRDKKYHLTLQKKKLLYDILNSAVIQGATFIVLPEFYLPFAWIDEVSQFARTHQIVVISGLQYITDGKRAFNYLANIQPFTSGFGYKNVLTLIREKNDYAPAEKKVLIENGFTCIDADIPIMQIISWNDKKYSNILCFEFTNIAARSNVKSKIELLFVIELNRDTNYFSSIVEASSRDLHCFIIQANTSKYGDSRIIAPYNTDNKNILQVKGGINPVVLIGEINTYELQLFHKNIIDRKNREHIKDFPARYNKLD